MAIEIKDPTSNVVAALEQAVKRQDDLRIAETRRIDQLMELRAQYAISQAGVLAAQVSASAEPIRVLIAAMAERLSSLERSKSEDRGSSGVTSPLITVAVAAVVGIVVFLIEHGVK